jgi:hypothetical protein
MLGRAFVRAVESAIAGHRVTPTIGVAQPGAGVALEAIRRSTVDLLCGPAHPKR